MQEKRIDDYWNVDSSKHLSDSWRRFTKLKEQLSKGYWWSGGILTKVQTTTWPGHVWPEVWKKIGKAAQNRENPKWKTRDGWKYCAQKQGETRIAAIMFPCSFECCVRKTINIGSTTICDWAVLCVKLSSTCIAATLPGMTDSQAWLGKELWWCLHHSKFGQQLVFMNDHFTHQSTLMSCLWQQTRS